MIVIIAGMYRSGSTFTFNIARELLDGDVEAVSANTITPAQLERAQGSQRLHLVIKTHHPDQALLDLIYTRQAACICSYRTPEAAVASWIETFGFSFDEAVSTIDDWLAWHHRLCYPVLNIAYPTIEDRPQRTILMIQRYLSGFINKERARELNQKYGKARLKQMCDTMREDGDSVNIGFSFYDPVSFFHRRHITSVERRVIGNMLTAQQVNAVRFRLANYVGADGEYRPGVGVGLSAKPSGQTMSTN
jgi:hypothetical protein